MLALVLRARAALPMMPCAADSVSDEVEMLVASLPSSTMLPSIDVSAAAPPALISPKVSVAVVWMARLPVVSIAFRFSEPRPFT